MNILTPDNQAFSMAMLPEEMVDDCLYGVLDYSDVNDVDYRWYPLLFLESFTAPAADLKIGNYRVTMPLDWHAVVGDGEFGDLEILPLTHLNDRGFNMFVFNPIKSYMPKFLPVEIMNIFPDVKWFVPKLKYGHLLTVPLIDHMGPIDSYDEKYTPLCSYFVKDAQRCPQPDLAQMI